MLTAREQQERQRVLESVLGTNAMEGITTPPEVRLLLERYANGDLTLSEFSSAMDAAAARVFSSKRELAGAA